MFDGVPIVGLSAPAIVMFGFLLIMTGRLVPRPTMQDKIDEAKSWREAYEKEREARVAADQQSRELLAGLKTNHEIIQAIFSNIEDIRQKQGATNVAKKR